MGGKSTNFYLGSLVMFLQQESWNQLFFQKASQYSKENMKMPVRTL